MKRSRLKPQSTRKAAHKRAVNPNRKQFVENKGRCERCGDTYKLSCHEICNGAAKEECEKHLDLCMCLCVRCHEEIQGWPKERQLAYRFEWSRTTACRILGLADTAHGREDVIREWVKL